MLQKPIDPDRDHIKGAFDSPVSLVEYGDFECPVCGQAYYELREVLQRLGGQVYFVFRDFPLSRVHPHAVAAAEAAEAAGVKGQFWAMHDLLFENQDRLAHADLLRYARLVGVDASYVSSALSTHSMLPKVREDFFSGVRSGVNGTPTLFINGRRHDGGWDAPSLIYALQAALESAPVHP